MGSRGQTAIAAIGAFLAAMLALGAVLIVTGAYNFAADAPHTALVRGLIGYARERSIAVRARDIAVPPLDDTKMIADGASDYDAMCTGCHLAPGMAENEMRPGLNPKPPVLAQAGPGRAATQFWIIKHGIKMTAMPAWGFTHSDTEIWNMVAFLQKLPALSPAQYRALVAQSGDHHAHEDRGAAPMDMGHMH
ncbi:MAG: cytochrome c [Rhizomicrobium sp.]|jgi:mono/diheme cytochrome c family protein